MGATRGGQRCYWLGVDGKAGDGPTQPREPGTHACVHPRYFDGSLPVAANDGDALVLVGAVHRLGERPRPDPPGINKRS